MTPLRAPIRLNKRRVDLMAIIADRIAPSKMNNEVVEHVSLFLSQNDSISRLASDIDVKSSSRLAAEAKNTNAS